MSFTTERGEAFEAMLDPLMYGTSLTYLGNPFDCIAPPIEQIKKMQQTGYDMDKPFNFAMRQSDFVTSKIANRVFIQYAGATFEVYGISTDSVDYHVDLTTFYKQ